MWSDFKNEGESEGKPERTCENCGEFVTKQFVRVFGTNDDTAYACMQCETKSRIRNGAASEPIDG